MTGTSIRFESRPRNTYLNRSFHGIVYSEDMSMYTIDADFTK